MVKYKLIFYVAAFFRIIVGSKIFYWFIVCAIFTSCLLVGWDTWNGIEDTNVFINSIDKLLIFIFVLEVFVKIGAEGRYPGRYFNDSWNSFDFVITIICIFSLSPAFVTFRILRVLRVFRLFSTIPKLQIWVGALLRSLPAISYVFLLLVIIFFIYGAMGVYFFADNDPFHFGTLPNALLSLFRVITLEDWTILCIIIYMALSPIRKRFTKRMWRTSRRVFLKQWDYRPLSRVCQ